jgi:lysophospholipase L1-like esterase
MASWDSRARVTAAICAVAVTIGCGGSSSGPTQPPSPSPTPPTEVFSISGFVFYDENRNNRLDADEAVRLGDVQIQIAGRTGTSAPTTGQVVVEAVPRGTFSVGIQTSSLPPFFVPGGAIDVDVPQSSAIPIPVALPVNGNNRWDFLAEGDSISQGTGSKDGKGYRVILGSKLSEYYQRPVTTLYRGGGGGTSQDGAARISRDLELIRPAYVLIMWGTNDWYACGDPRSCFTIPSLRTIVESVKAAGSLPCIATIPPANVGYDQFAPPSRNVWVADANDLIRNMAREEGALLVDVYAAFMKEPTLSALFVDHVHPDPAGHELIATTFFDALTRPRSSSDASSSFWANEAPLPSAPAAAPRSTTVLGLRPFSRSTRRVAPRTAVN